MPSDMVKDKLKPANKRSLARFFAVQALYQMEVSSSGVAETIEQYEKIRMKEGVEGREYLAADLQWFRAIVSGVVKQQTHLDPLIAQTLTPDWPLSRLEATLRAILRAASWELLVKRDVPDLVVIDEYLEIAKAFLGNEEIRLINAVLDRLRSLCRPPKEEGA